MKSTFSIIFYLKRQVVKKDGTVPVLETVISCESSPSSNMFFRCLPIAGKPTQMAVP